MRFSFTSVAKSGSKLAKRQRAQVAVDAVAHRHRAGRLFLFADHEHVGNLLQLGLADLVPDLLRPIIARDAKAVLAAAQPRPAGRSR